MNTIRVFFPPQNQSTFFDFQKGAGEISPPLAARLYIRETKKHEIEDMIFLLRTYQYLNKDGVLS